MTLIFSSLLLFFLAGDCSASSIAKRRVSASLKPPDMLSEWASVKCLNCTAALSYVLLYRKNYRLSFSFYANSLAIFIAYNSIWLIAVVLMEKYNRMRDWCNELDAVFRFTFYFYFLFFLFVPSMHLKPEGNSYLKKLLVKRFPEKRKRKERREN